MSVSASDRRFVRERQDALHPLAELLAQRETAAQEQARFLEEYRRLLHALESGYSH